MSEWQMVPVEPTLDMLHAAVEHQNAHADEPGWAGLYNAMIAAAPPAPSAEPSEPVAWTRDGWGPDCGSYVEFYTPDEMGSRDRTGLTPLYAHPAPADPSAACVDAMRMALEALRVAVTQNEHDMLMTGEECRAASAAIDALRAQIEQIGGGR